MPPPPSAPLFYLLSPTNPYLAAFEEREKRRGGGRKGSITLSFSVDNWQEQSETDVGCTKLRSFVPYLSPSSFERAKEKGKTNLIWGNLSNACHTRYIVGEGEKSFITRPILPQPPFSQKDEEKLFS